MENCEDNAECRPASEPVETSNCIFDNPLIEAVTLDESAIQPMDDQSFTIQDFKVTPCLLSAKVVTHEESPVQLLEDQSFMIEGSKITPCL